MNEEVERGEGIRGSVSAAGGLDALIGRRVVLSGQFAGDITIEFAQALGGGAEIRDGA